ncbi:unnamed protein product, partial [Ectocarpus sp. 8 AP-2014]
TAPSTVLGSPASANVLLLALEELLEVEDQDSLRVVITREGTARRRRRRLRLRLGMWGEEEDGRRDGSEGGGALRQQKQEAEEYRRRRLEVDETTSEAEFEVVFINDPGETAAAERGTEASVKLLEGQESLAEALGTTASEVSIDDVVYSSTTASAVDTDDAATTFFEENSGPASAAAVAIAGAILIAA